MLFVTLDLTDFVIFISPRHFGVIAFLLNVDTGSNWWQRGPRSILSQVHNASQGSLRSVPGENAPIYLVYLFSARLCLQSDRRAKREFKVIGRLFLNAMKSVKDLTGVYMVSCSLGSSHCLKHVIPTSRMPVCFLLSLY